VGASGAVGSLWVVVHNADVAWEALYYMYLSRFTFGVVVVSLSQMLIFPSGADGMCTSDRLHRRAFVSSSQSNHERTKHRFVKQV
jgi:hypothetical protein